MKSPLHLRIFFVTITVMCSFYSKAQTVSELLKQCDSLSYNEKFREAIPLYNTILKKDSTVYEAWVGRGSAYHMVKDDENAFKDFTRAIELQPDSAIAYHYRALIFLSAMYSDESIQDNTIAIQLTENNSLRKSCYVNRGAAKEQKRDFQGAYEDYSKAYFMDTTEVSVINNIATVLDELGRQTEATQYLKKVILMDSTFTGAYVNLGFQYTKMGKYKEAVDVLNKALTIEKDEPFTLNNRGFAKYYLKDYKGAMEDINKSISIYPNNSYAYKNRALVFIALNQMNKACDDLHKAIELGFTHMYGEEVNELLKSNCNTK